VSTEAWLGRRGEDLAAHMLTDLGAQLLSRNYRCTTGEIDLVLDHEDDLVAVEVKTRSSIDLESPEEAVTRRKLRRIVDALKDFAAQDETDALLARHWRVDLVAIEMELDGTVVRCDHIRDIYPA
jgi:putative endonuclease